MALTTYRELIGAKILTEKECIVFSYLYISKDGFTVESAAKALYITPLAVTKALVKLRILQWAIERDGKFFPNVELMNQVLSTAKSIDLTPTKPQKKQSKKVGEKAEHEPVQTSLPVPADPVSFNQSPSQGAIVQTSDTPRTARPRFQPPSVQEVSSYLTDYIAKKIAEGETRFNAVDPQFAAESMIDFYSAKNWKIGKETMKDWQASARRCLNWDTIKNSKYRNNYSQKDLYNMSKEQKQDMGEDLEDQFAKYAVYNEDGTLNLPETEKKKIAIEMAEEAARKAHYATATTATTAPSVRTGNLIEGTATQVSSFVNK